MGCTSRNNTGTTQSVFSSSEDIDSLQRHSRSVPASDAAGQTLSLADQIERIGRALTADELASILTVSRITIFKQAKAGRIPSFRIGTCVRFDPKSVAQWLREM